jgi:hypothetical protein
MQKEKKICLPEENIFTSGRYKKALFYIAISLLHPSPIFDGLSYTTYNDYVGQNITRSINSLLCILVLMRFHFVLRFIIFVLNYMTPETNNYCKKHFFEVNIFFAVKSLIQSFPILIYSICGVFFVYAFTFSTRVFERGLAPYNPSQNFNNFFNAAWYILITMTTVGYGDFVVKTNEGRIIAMFACITGVFLISLLILTLTNFLNLSSNDLLLSKILERIELNDEQDKSAKEIVGHFLKLAKKTSSIRRSIIGEDPNVRMLKKSVSKFQEAKQEINNSNTDSITYPFSILGNGVNYMAKEYESLDLEEKKINDDLFEIKDKLVGIYEDLCLNYD